MTNDEPIEAILRDAGVVWCGGMRPLILDGGEWTGACRIDDYQPETAKAPADAVPDLHDPATYALCLAQLARRRGRNPEQGVVFQEDYGTWTVTAHGFTGSVVFDDIPTDIDHRRALALALRATAPKETT